MIVGLPDYCGKRKPANALKSTSRLNNYEMPRTKVVVNLAPQIKKSGTAFDLPIAIGILAASEQIENAEALKPVR